MLLEQVDELHGPKLVDFDPPGAKSATGRLSLAMRMGFSSSLGRVSGGPMTSTVPVNIVSFVVEWANPRWLLTLFCKLMAPTRAASVGGICRRTANCHVPSTSDARESAGYDEMKSARPVASVVGRRSGQTAEWSDGGVAQQAVGQASAPTPGGQSAPGAVTIACSARRSIFSIAVLGRSSTTIIASGNLWCARRPLA